MANTSYLLLYVNDPAASARFYAALLEQEPIEAHPGFVLFVLPSGLALGLWRRSEVTPPAPVAGERAEPGAELGFKVADAAAVDATCAAWRARGAEIVAPPVDLDFGRSFVACDPDGHRLRVFAANDEEER
jgi:catechol 2,3-dioxygenase-like lactoylglutathione lyase family enzyme